MNKLSPQPADLAQRLQGLLFPLAFYHDAHTAGAWAVVTLNDGSAKALAVTLDAIAVTHAILFVQQSGSMWTIVAHQLV